MHEGKHPISPFHDNTMTLCLLQLRVTSERDMISGRWWAAVRGNVSVRYTRFCKTECKGTLNLFDGGWSPSLIMGEDGLAV